MVENSEREFREGSQRWKKGRREGGREDGETEGAHPATCGLSSPIILPTLLRIPRQLSTE